MYGRIAHRVCRLASASLVLLLLFLIPAAAQRSNTNPPPSDSVLTGERPLEPSVASTGTILVDSVDPAPVFTMSNLLQARTPGLSVMESSGAAGAGARVTLRGPSSVNYGNEPLVIVDGIRQFAIETSPVLQASVPQTSRLNDLRPEDIQRIDVLRGPAATALLAPMQRTASCSSQRALGSPDA